MKVAIIGATPNQSRYAYFAAEMLHQYGYDFVPLGIKSGEVFGKEIIDIRTYPKIEDIDTFTLYIGPNHQPDYYDYILSQKPNRIIFNPGTENTELVTLAKEHGIVTQEACTLVMLRLGNFKEY